MLKKTKQSNRIFSSLIILSLSLLLTFPAMAQVDITGQFRPRSEYLHGFGTPRSANQEYSLFTTQRTRLNMNVKKEKYSFKVVLQDVRTWGNVPQMVTNDGALTTLHESYATLNLKNNFSIKAGRQEIDYDDQRIFGSVQWAQQARSHDALIVRHQQANTKIHLGLAYNQDRPLKRNNFYPVQNNYKTFQYLWLNQQINDNMNLSILALNNGLQAGTIDSGATIRYSQTAGGRFIYKNKSFKAIAAAYTQMGETRNGTKINALYYRGDVSYKLNSKHLVAVGYEVLSGNDYFSGNNEQNAFAPLYGTNHKFNGWMDYFYVGNYAGNAGLRDIIVQYNFNLKDNWKSSVFVHQFSTDGDVKENENASVMDPNLGYEVDFMTTWVAANDVKLQAGYSQVFGTSTLEFIKGGDASKTNHFFWLMVTVSPKILSIDNK